MSAGSSERGSETAPSSSAPQGFFRISRQSHKDLGPPWLVILLTMVIFALSQFAAAILLAVGLAAFKPNSSITELLNQSAPVQFFYVLAAEGLVVILTLLVVKKWRGFKLAFI